MDKSDDKELKELLSEIKSERKELAKKEEALALREAEVKQLLAGISKMTPGEAEKTLLAEIERELKGEIAKRIRAAEEKIRAESKKEAEEILVMAMKNGATTYSADYTVSTVPVADEDVKGRIIGREGRNIRAFEKATGVELELDEGNSIRISSFDSIRREIARRSLVELLKDTRIQPSRIEDVVKKTKTQMDDILMEEGQKIAEECGVFNLPNEIIMLLGRFRFRTSYGQNLAVHTIEEVKIGVAIANEIGADVEVTRLGCMLADIGKVITEDEGTHIELGVKLLKKHGFPKGVINAVAEHHEDKPFSAVESVIVWIADAVSGSRPGARYEPHEDYLKRMDKIEDIATSFKGVDKAYAFQAGRDVRIIVKPEEVDDDAITILAREVARRLEKEAEYVGRIKVTVVREVRAMETTAAR
ncbi:ribonuclease Y [Candidatus Woesebacteria bacterium]|nr:MAG: ribonuclease Y [Candidatus Woesebacteria bacterium]